jgi:hypothetical protein
MEPIIPAGFFFLETTFLMAVHRGSHDDKEIGITG